MKETQEDLKETREDLNEEDAIHKEEVFAFRKLGGIEQFVLQNDWEWQNLAKLDPKLWVALSCPTTGLEFNQEVLDLLDLDNDGHIHIPDVIRVVEWICKRLKHPSHLSLGKTEIEIDNLRDDSDSGKKLILAAQQILEKNNKDSAEQVITLSEIQEVIKDASAYPFNGDGVVPPDSAEIMPENTPLSKDMGKLIRLALSLVGGVKDASGKPGLNIPLYENLCENVKKALAWRESLKKANLPLGENTAEAWQLFQKLFNKLDDFYKRCNLLAYAPEASAQINSENIFQNLNDNNSSSGLLDTQTLELLPAAKINPDKIIDLKKGLNPFWAEDLLKFHTLVQPIIHNPEAQLTEDDWKKIKSSFDVYAAILNDKPQLKSALPQAEIINLPGFPTLALADAGDALDRAYMPVDPNQVLGNLTSSELEDILSSQTKDNFLALVAKDKAAPPLACFEELKTLSLYHAHLYTFLNNFISFTNFYEPPKKAIFQSGTLYLDGKASLLCVPVTDIDDHVRLSAQSFLCLIYCGCTRKAADGSEAAMTIAGAVTIGMMANLIEGRNGLFIDNFGNEWDAKIVRILHNPISLKEAMWAPYIRIGNLISEQVHKFVSSKEEAIADASKKAVETPAPPEAPKQGFDFAKGAGIFAALGIALSAVSATFAYIVNSLASLGWLWPLAIILVFICISGPSMLLAWFKLRKRGLGPLLDASGWAINRNAPINLLMGSQLTQQAKIPANAKRDLNDPYGIIPKPKSHFGLILFLLIICAIAGIGIYCFVYGIPEWLGFIKNFKFN